MKFIATTAEKMKDISIANGQLIFSRDDRVIYLDSDIGRTAYETIITLVDEDQRTALRSPVKGYYFVEDTCEFWRNIDGSRSGWVQITNKPDERLVFEASKETLPPQGKKGVLYCVPDAIYQWDAGENNYVNMGSETWGSIE